MIDRPTRTAVLYLWRCLRLAGEILLGSLILGGTIFLVSGCAGVLL